MAKIFDVHTPAELKNYIKNGALDFWQEKAGTTTTINTTASTTRFADMFINASAGSTNKNYSMVRSTDVPSIAQSGFSSTYSSLFTMITGISSPAASDYINTIYHAMEGFDYERLHTKVVTFGFWVKASVPGTYSFAVGNSAGTRSYVTTFAVNGASTWEFKSITITLDNSGTWAFDNSAGLLIYIGSIAGSTFSTSTLNAWQGGVFFASTTNTNWQGTTGATFQVAQISVVEGSLGLGPTGFVRQGKDISQEFTLCQRYYSTMFEFAGFGASSTVITVGLMYPVPMRATPTIGCTASTITMLSATQALTQSSFSVTPSSQDNTYVEMNVNNFSSPTLNTPFINHPAASGTGLKFDARL